MSKDKGSRRGSTREATQQLARSAKTGEWVTKAFAKTHPSTTVVETIHYPNRKRL